MHRKPHREVHGRFPPLDSHDADAIHPSRFLASFSAGRIASNPGAERSQALTSKRIITMASVDHTRMANAIRGLAMDAVEKAKSGHPGLPMGAADVATVLFTQFLKFDASDS